MEVEAARISNSRPPLASKPISKPPFTKKSINKPASANSKPASKPKPKFASKSNSKPPSKSAVSKSTSKAAVASKSTAIKSSTYSFSKQNELKKNADVFVKVLEQSETGEGIARIGTATIMIPNTLPGDEVLAKVIKLDPQKKVGFGKLLELQKPSFQRLIVIPCPVAEKCED